MYEYFRQRNLLAYITSKGKKQDLMNIRFTFLILIMTIIVSCGKEDDVFMNMTFDDQKFVGKILPDNDGYWVITRTIQNKNCPYCSSMDFIDGIAYSTNQKTVSKDAIGYLLDAEIKNNSLLTITNSEILNFNQALQSSVVLSAGNNETFKLMDKDNSDKVWFLSNKSVFTIEGDNIPFQNNIPAIDFEAAKDKSFWIASPDTVYHLSRSGVKKFSISEISGIKNNTSTIYSLKIDMNDSIWMNTSEEIFKYKEDNWKAIKVGNFVSDNFKSVPFMDVDANGTLWLAEKHYQAFTNLHRFDGTNWTSYKLDPPLETWITDIEKAEPGSIWIGTVSGLLKINI